MIHSPLVHPSDPPQPRLRASVARGLALLLTLCAACGSQPAGDADIGGTDLPDVDVEAGARDTSSPDSSDTPDIAPDVVPALDTDTTHPEDVPPPDIDDIELDAPPIDPCAQLSITCTVEDQPVSSPVSLVLPYGTASCSLHGQEGQEVLNWSLRADGYTRSLSSSTYVPRAEVWAWGSDPGVSQLVVTTPTCEVAGPSFTILPPTTGWWFSLAWDVPGRRRTEEFADVDLHLLRAAGDCWFDRQRDLHFGSPNTLDWGATLDADDNPHQGGDHRMAPGFEASWALRIADDETWEIGAHVRMATEREPIDARMTVYHNGELLASFQQTFTTPGYWRIATVDERSVVPIQLVSETVPACTPPVLVECDGRIATPETCNGIDDDCDGEVDEFPEACSENASPSTCLFIPQTPADPYRCIEL